MTERHGRETPDPRVLLITSNGAGMGHLTRMLAVALATSRPEHVTIMSMSVALPVVTDQGVRGEYCPSADRGWLVGPRWHAYLADRVVALAQEVGADVIAFDGVAPYRGLALAAQRLPQTAFVWMRRGLWRPGANLRQLEAGSWFDLIIEPGDLAQAADRGGTAGRGDASIISPVSLLDVIEPLPRDQARAELGLVGEGPTLLITLGSGRLGDVATPGRVVLETASQFPDWQLALTRSAIATQDVPAGADDRIQLVSGVYPLVRYLRAFDAVVSAAGYNAVHEFVTAGVPTLLVPNASTRTDDQVGRAAQLAADGLALSADAADPEGLAAAVRQLLDDSGSGQVRARLTEAVAALAPERRGGGARQAAHLLALTATGLPARQSQDAGRSASRPGQTLRRTVRTVLGRRGTNMLKRALGRPLEPAPLPPLPVRFIEVSSEIGDSAQAWPQTAHPDGGAADTERVVLLGSDLPPGRIRQGGPVEHLVPGAGTDYRERRRELARRHYEQR